jgi:hypothetical protein
MSTPAAAIDAENLGCRHPGVHRGDTEAFWTCQRCRDQFLFLLTEAHVRAFGEMAE